MDYRPLGNTGVKVSELCLGTAFRAQDDEQVCIEVIDRAIDRGCNFIDSALYGNGLAEEVGGKALELGSREAGLQVLGAGLVRGDKREVDFSGSR